MPKPGRPKGSRNVQRAVVTSIPPRCPECGRSLEHLGRKTRERSLPRGLAPDSLPAQHLRTRHVKCPCGKHIAVRQYVAGPA